MLVAIPRVKRRLIIKPINRFIPPGITEARRRTKPDKAVSTTGSTSIGLKGKLEKSMSCAILAGISVLVNGSWLVVAPSEIELIVLRDSMVLIRARRKWREIWIEFDTAKYRRGGNMVQVLRQKLPDDLFLPEIRRS